MVDAKTKIIVELKRRHAAAVNPREWVSANELLNIFSFDIITRMKTPEEIHETFRELIEEGRIREKDNMQYFQLSDYEEYMKEIETQWRKKSKIKRSLVKKKYKFSD
ncbi:MAG: hypothetical protein ACFFCD_13405 [Promethearchaeota archaeon]